LGYAQIEVPDGLDGPALPAAIATMVEDMDPHLVQHVADTAERDDRLAGAPVPTVAISTGDGTTWIKVAAPNTWATLWEPVPDWQPLTLVTGFSAGQTTPQIRVEANGRAHIRGRIVRTDASDINTFSGVKLADVPPGAIPATLAFNAGGSSLAGDPVNAVVRVEVHGATTSNSLGGPGSIVAYSQDGQGDTVTGGLDWIDISGSYWLD